MKLIEICPVGVALLHSDGRTNMTRPSRFFQLLCERATKKITGYIFHTLC